MMFNVENFSCSGLSALSLSISAAELACLSGPSGSGKTLLLRALADLDVSTGVVQLNGQAREQFSPQDWRSRVAYLPADSHWWAPSVGEHFQNMDYQCLAELGFDRDVSGWQVERMSSGERQRLAMVRVLENKPSVLLLDEPTSNLDEENAQKVEQLVVRYVKENALGCLWVTHASDQIARIAQRTLYLNNGSLEETLCND